MNVYELNVVSGNPRKNDHHYYEHRVYNNALYMEAEVSVESNLEEEISDEEFDQLVEKELARIMEILKEHGRYPVNGIPRFVTDFV